jgi:hypothetical protein
VRLLGTLLAAVPFAFASLRLLATGHDTRYLWVAGASTLCATVIVVRSRASAALTPARMAAATIACAACAAVAAAAAGATAAAGIAIIAAAFGLCSAVGIGLVARSRVRKMG